MVTAIRRSLWVRGLTLGVLIEACFALIPQTQAQESALDFYNRGYAANGKRDYDRAIADFNEAIRLAPNYPAAYNNRGYAWNGKKEYDRAIADFNQAITLDSNNAQAYNNRGYAWNAKKEFDKAIADFDRAIAIDPNYAHAYSNRGDAWNGKQRYDRAIADFKQAIRLDPKYLSPYNSLAWIQATCPDARFRDGRKAYENASRAYQLSGGNDAWYIDTLAAAYAENGDFQQAQEWEAKAIEMTKSEKEKRDYHSRLLLYERGKPYR
jgi:tetratricopeptide (TPR) repeat protein